MSLVVALDCERCDQLGRRGEDIRQLAREIGELRAQLRPLIEEYRALYRGHLRCAFCGICVGQGHSEAGLTPEPVWGHTSEKRGQRRYDVCASCYAHLYRVQRSVPEQRSYEREQDALVGLAEGEPVLMETRLGTEGENSWLTDDQTRNPRVA